MPSVTRRTVGLALGALAVPTLAVPPLLRPARAAEASLAEIERRVGGRLGVSLGWAPDAGATPLLAHRADERFPMCSTFKALATAAVLARVDAGAESLDRTLTFGPAELLSYAPVSRKAMGADGVGRMTVDAACAASVVWSDNTAANLQLATLGGPAGLTAWLRGLGDGTTRLDRTETELNTAIPGDPRDTTTPAAMRETLGRILLGPVLSPASRDRLEGWMVGAQTGFKRLRAGLPADWTVGDKTGSGDNGTANVVALLRPPGRAPLIAAVYLTGATASAAEIDAAYAEIGRLVAAAAGGR
ncbi:class A beta-lactamase [Methylobacterium sp. NEAU 140]|uniref:class A beta-lactamase n=1 Tax=Methylobacterium sp. NEAU 140 TaxID=3064945 RepID=UPI0027370AB6|nr:class A beta-lactamase [Methylobacterium sp. NEAU 140]MDP4025491.1 class A beta-lactamase [Methylobacterium sp. NEAU 140]